MGVSLVAWTAHCSEVYVHFARQFLGRADVISVAAC